MTARIPRNIDKAIAIGLPLNADGQTPIIDCRDFDYALVTVEWAGGSATDATVWLNVSNSDDGTNLERAWIPAHSMKTTTGWHHFDVPLHAIPFLNVQLSHGSNTTGTWSVTCWLKV